MASEAELPDLQVLWETSLMEIALEGSNGCTLQRLWTLVKLDGPREDGSVSQPEKEGGAPEMATEPDPREFLKGWLWRYV